MSRGPEIPRNIFVAGLARFRTDELRADDARRREDRAIRFKRAARKKNDGERGCSPDCPQQLFAFTVQPYDWPQESHLVRIFNNYLKIDYAFLRRKYFFSIFEISAVFVA